DGTGWNYLDECVYTPLLYFNEITDYHTGIVTSGAICSGDSILYGPVYFDELSGWTSLGEANNIVHMLKVIQDTLYIGGGFTEIGGESVQYIAKFNGSHWEPAFSHYPIFT